jgi:hypothetical protein
MTSRSNCNVLGFHNAFRGTCVVKSAKNGGLNGMRCDRMRFTLISVILSIMCAKLCFTCVCVQYKTLYSVLSEQLCWNKSTKCSEVESACMK